MKSPLVTVGFFKSTPEQVVRPMRIPANRLFFEMITEGAVYGFDDDQSLHGVGSIFAHSPGELTVSRTEPTGYYACLTVSFRLDGVSAKPAWPRHFFWDDTKAVLQFAEEVLFAYHNAALDHDIISDLIWSTFNFRLEHFKRRATQAGIPPRIAAVIAYVDKNYADPIGVEDMAAHVDLSASHLHARFREFFNQTPHQYLIHVRMRAASHLLVTSDEPIKAVADRVGYANTENFCRAFKQYYDRTAAAYRRRYRTYSDRS